MPGDLSGVRALSPPPARPSGCLATGLYIVRELAGQRVPAVCDLPSAPRGGRAGHPEARKSALCFSFLSPHAILLGTPQTSPLCFPLPLFSSIANFRSFPRPSPVIRRGSSSAAPPRGFLRTSQPATATITESRNMSTTLLSAFYDIDFLCKVRGGPRREKADKQEALRVFRLCLLPSAFGGPLSTLTFGVEKNPRVCRGCCLCLVGGEKQGGRKGWRERL